MVAGHQIADLNRTLEGIYDDYRTILLNAKYNGERLRRVRRLNRILEFVIVIGASGSGIAGFTLWKTDYGQYAWGTISAAAIIVTILKPILDLDHDIEEHSQLWAEYSTLNARCRNIVRTIDSTRSMLANAGELPKALADEVQDIRTKLVELAPRGDQNPSETRLEALQAQVNAEIPPATLWIVPSEAAPDA
ncbi:MAG TPA: hypothetical protein VGQ90_10155 [Stellaceae bacterium]|jgi:hypothetical protein|nr:hypothetical protein [Stellaceae bacterium]